MMRGSLVVLWLLLSVASASAECAWVVWQNPYIDEAQKLVNLAAWEPRQGFETSQVCVDAAKHFAEREGRMFIFRCLPDTVDPRGPKGGGR